MRLFIEPSESEPYPIVIRYMKPYPIVITYIKPYPIVPFDRFQNFKMHLFSGSFAFLVFFS